MSKLADETIRPLAQAMKEASLPHRDLSVAREPMTNFKCTPGGLNDCPMTFWASWQLPSRPRRIALLLDDCQEEYRPFAHDAGIISNLVQLVNVFRTKKEEVAAAEPEGEGGVCLAWSSWSRVFDDGISNAMDRWYGPRGLCPKNYQNALYIAEGAPGMEILKEVEPTEEEKADGWHYHGKHLDMFWSFDENGDSYLDEKLKAQGIDTVVIVGLWTDECITSTAYAASSRGYDVIVVSDAVATATANGDIALPVINGTCGNVLTTADVVSYMKNDFVLGQVGACKGVKHPDGRKDN